METRCVSSGETLLKWRLLKSWCMTCLLQHWLSCDGVGLPCGVQTLPWFHLVKMKRLRLCFCFSITAFLEESLWFYSLEYPELEKRMIFLSLTSSCFSRLAPACTFFFLVLHISTSVHIFCLAFFFPLSFTRKWQCTLPSQQEVVCLAESILTFLSIKIG